MMASGRDRAAGSTSPRESPHTSRHGRLSSTSVDEIASSTGGLKSDSIDKQKKSLRSMNPEYKHVGLIASSGLRRAEDAVPAFFNRAFVAEFHPDVMQSATHLARLKPERAT